MGLEYDAFMALFDAIARAWYLTCLPTDTSRATPSALQDDAVWILTRPKIAALTLQRLEQFVIRQREEMSQYATLYLDVQQRKEQGYTMLSFHENQATARLLNHQVRLLHLPSTVQETVAQVAQHITGIWARLTPAERFDLLGLTRWHYSQFCDVCNCHGCRTPKESCRKCEIDESAL